jgi:hypothetical protein
MNATETAAPAPLQHCGRGLTLAARRRPEAGGGWSSTKQKRPRPISARPGEATT